MFDVQDFDLLIGHPIEKFLTDASTQGTPEVRPGKETNSVQIATATNTMIEPSLDSEPIEEVKGILLVDSLESLLEKDAEKFIEEEDDSTKPVDISKFETTPRPPIEFEPLSSGSEKVVLDRNRDSTTICHDESLEMENPWATEFGKAPILESKEKDSLDEHGSFTLEIPQESCSFNASPESGMLSASCTHEKSNHSKVFSCKIFWRVVVDAFIYRKHCKFRWCTVALTL